MMPLSTVLFASSDNAGAAGCSLSAAARKQDVRIQQSEGINLSDGVAQIRILSMQKGRLSQR